MSMPHLPSRTTPPPTVTDITQSDHYEPKCSAHEIALFDRRLRQLINQQNSPPKRGRLQGSPSKALAEVPASRQQSHIAQKEARRYGVVEVMQTLAGMGQPCPKQRAAHLVKVYGDDSGSGLLQQHGMDRMLQDIQGSSPLHEELRLAWTCVQLASQTDRSSTHSQTLPYVAERAQQITLPRPRPLSDYSSSPSPVVIALSPSGESRSPSHNGGSPDAIQTPSRGCSPLLHHGSAPGARSQKEPSSLNSEPNTSVAMHLRNFFLTRMKEMVDVLKEWDSDHDRAKISYSELEKALLSVGITDSREVANIWKQFDKDGNGEIEYNEVLDALKITTSSDQHTKAVRWSESTQSDAQRLLQDAFSRMANNRVMDVFRSWDSDSSGSITRYEFAKAIAVMGLNPKRDQMEKLFDQLDLDGSGKIDYHELEIALAGNVGDLGDQFRTEDLPQAPSHLVASKPPPRTSQRLKPLDPLRPLAGQLSDLLLSQMRRVVEAFDEWDTDGSNSISCAEFEKAMVSFGLKPSSKVKSLFLELDKDGNGEIGYEELLAALDPPKVPLLPKQYGQDRSCKDALSAGLKVRQSATQRSIAEQLHEAFSEVATDRVLDVFRAWDEDSGGSISRHELAKAVATLGIKATKTELNRLFIKLDPDNSGQIEYKELYKAIKDHRPTAHGARDYT